MKKLIIILFCFISIVTLNSCEDGVSENVELSVITFNCCNVEFLDDELISNNEVKIHMDKHNIVNPLFLQEYYQNYFNDFYICYYPTGKIVAKTGLIDYLRVDYGSVLHYSELVGIMILSNTKLYMTNDIGEDTGDTILMKYVDDKTYHLIVNDKSIGRKGITFEVIVHFEIHKLFNNFSEEII